MLNRLINQVLRIWTNVLALTFAFFTYFVDRSQNVNPVPPLIITCLVFMLVMSATLLLQRLALPEDKKTYTNHQDNHRSDHSPT